MKMPNGKKRRRKRGKKMGAEFTPVREETPSVTPEVPPVEKEEAPAEVVEKPPAPEPKRMSDDDMVFTYLNEHGASGPARIVKSLGIEWTAVMVALRNLRDKGKISLR